MTVLSLAVKLMLFIAVGYVARKLKVMPDGFDKMLTRFVMAVPIPCMIIQSLQVEFSIDTLLRDCPIILGLSAGSMLVIYLISRLICLPMKKDIGKTVTFCLMFSNFTFMGLPVVAEIYGAEGTFNYVIFTLLIRFFFYGVGPITLSGGGHKMDLKEAAKQFFCEPVVSVFIGLFLYITQLQLPAVIDGVMSDLGDMASPLGLILCGVIIADAKWSGLTKYPVVFVASALRLLVIPAIAIGLFLLIGVEHSIIRTTVFYFAMPAASLTPAMLLRYNSEAVDARNVAGFIVVVSTLACVVTIPIWTVIIERICG